MVSQCSCAGGSSFAALEETRMMVEDLAGGRGLVQRPVAAVWRLRRLRDVAAVRRPVV
jgi:hypothetical protein